MKSRPQRNLGPWFFNGVQTWFKQLSELLECVSISKKSKSLI
jgi:hypothetical protein